MAELVNLEKLKDIVEDLKTQGKKIVFANGCFDILHVGHIRYLKAAKGIGDILIVGVNSDVSVKKIKGEHRPIVPDYERVEILSEFPFIDYIVLFDETDVTNILLTIRPDFHAKGTDYTEDSVPERHIVLSYGGQVVICGDKKTHSSTDIIKKIKVLD